MTETRKLVAILVADVVGYSRLAGADEERTLARRPQFAPQEGQGPLKVARREAVRKAIGLGCKLRRARESCPGFLGGEPLRPHHRLAVGGL